MDLKTERGGSSAPFHIQRIQTNENLLHYFVIYSDLFILILIIERVIQLISNSITKDAGISTNIYDVTISVFEGKILTVQHDL